jgi:hypothetical protein
MLTTTTTDSRLAEVRAFIEAYDALKVIEIVEIRVTTLNGIRARFKEDPKSELYVDIEAYIEHSDGYVPYNLSSFFFDEEGNKYIEAGIGFEVVTCNSFKRPTVLELEKHFMIAVEVVKLVKQLTERFGEKFTALVATAEEERTRLLAEEHDSNNHSAKMLVMQNWKRASKLALNQEMRVETTEKTALSNDVLQNVYLDKHRKSFNDDIYMSMMFGCRPEAQQIKNINTKKHKGFSVKMIPGSTKLALVTRTH